MIGVNFQQSLFGMVKDEANGKLSVNHRKTMSWLSRAIELTALQATGPLRIFSGFQSMQFFLPVMKRYTKLAERAEVFIYGYPDIVPPPIPGLRYIKLEQDDPLVKEWFIVANSPDFCNALVTEDEAGLSVPHNQRRFKGLLTYDHTLIQRLDDALSAQIALPTKDQGRLNTRQTMIMTMVSTLQDASYRALNDSSLNRELNQIINQYISPAMGPTERQAARQSH